MGMDVGIEVQRTRLAVGYKIQKREVVVGHRFTYLVQNQTQLHDKL